VSATLGSAEEWDRTTIVGYEEIAGCAREQLLTYGCGRLARDLLADGLLDVLVLSITPVVAAGSSLTEATTEYRFHAPEQRGRRRDEPLLLVHTPRPGT
jgi:dihydrofolate reductase